MLTLVKFIDNYTPESRNKIITRTLGKLGVVDGGTLSRLAEKPKPREFWYCDIIKETGAGSAKGVFVLSPLRKIKVATIDGFETVDVVHLVPGMFDAVKEQNVMLIYPKTAGPNWIMSNVLRQHLMGRDKTTYAINSVVVVFDKAKDWPKEYADK
jgi:hypothetical protein